MRQEKESRRYRDWILFLSVVFSYSAHTVNSLRWIQKPNDTTEAVEGTIAELKWDYDLESDYFRMLEWIYMKTGKTIADRDSSSSKPFVNPYFPRFNVSDTENATLIISNVMRTDNGRYMCKLKTRENRAGIENVVNLDVLYPPENTNLSTTVNTSAVIKNGNVTFECTTEGNPEPDEYKFYHEPTSTYLGSSKSSTFYTQVTKSGRYLCVPVNKVGEGHNASVYITVVVPPEVTVSSLSVQVLEGESVTLFCNASGDPKPSLKWTKNDDPTVISESTNITFNVSRHQSQNHTIKYHCTATNGYGQPMLQTATSAVTIIYKPENTKCQTQRKSNVFLKGKNNVTFFYSAEARPQGCNVSLTKHVVAGKRSDVAITTEKGLCNGSLAQLDTLSTLNMAGGVHRFSCLPENFAGFGERAYVNITVTVPAAVIKLADVTALENSNVTLNCTVQGFPTPHVTWFSPNGTLLQNRTSDTNLSLINVSRQRSGTYRCNVSNKLGSDSKTMDFVVLFSVKPKVLSVVPDDTVVIEQNSVHLAAVVEGNPVPHVAWISPTGKVLQNSTESWNFTLANITRKEGGKYRCIATNIVGKDVKVVTITVQFPATVLLPEQDINVTAVEGRSKVVLVCIVEGFPVPHVTWIFPNGTTLQNQSSSETNLTLINLSRHARGTYRCNATNKLGSDTVKVNLDVWFQPKLLSVSPRGNTTVKEFSIISLGAVVEGNPAPYVAWISPRGLTLQNNTKDFNYTMNNVTRENRGNYQCIAGNQLGSDKVELKINIKFPATITASSPNVSRVLEGSNTKLVCIVEGFPIPRVAWIGPDGAVLQNRTSNTNLSLNNVSRESSGIYQCNASNELGSDVTKTSLVVLYKPTLSYCGGNITVTEGDNVSVGAVVEGKPSPYVAWISPSGSVLQNETERFNYTTTAITRDKQGGYQCIATNFVGIDEKEFFIIVRFAGTVVHVTEEFEPGTDVPTALYCRAEGNPPPQVWWIDPAGEVQGNATGEVRINLQNVKPGNYTCKASNVVGSTKRVYFVYPTGERDTKVSGRLKTMDSYKEEYNNVSSEEFQSYARRLSASISEEISKGHYEARGVRINKLSKGSIIADFTIFFRGIVDPENATNLLKEAVQNGQLGDIPVYNDSFYIDLPTTPTPTAVATEEPVEKCSCKNGGTCKQGKCDCPFIRGGKTCNELSMELIIIIVVVSLLAVVCLGCLARNCSRNGHRECSANLHNDCPGVALENLAFDKFSPSCHDNVDGGNQGQQAQGAEEKARET